MHSLTANVVFLLLSLPRFGEVLVSGILAGYLPIPLPLFPGFFMGVFPLRFFSSSCHSSSLLKLLFHLLQILTLPMSVCFVLELHYLLLTLPVFLREMDLSWIPEPFDFRHKISKLVLDLCVLYFKTADGTRKFLKK
ncbi:hypothetical protein L2E82_29722 [Cichorium intybus]|uniref:Uncharacterized protein n=1 Tax=Cichorium intybus TaxID=13427 RepID=A0ACB9CYB2_CICIN|nr:hypothetical protein L2E82_29722 [Cichorium intybus]